MKSRLLHKEIPFERMAVFSGIQLYEQLSERRRYALYAELCELRGLYDLYDVRLNDELATAAQLKELGILRQAVHRIASFSTKEAKPAKRQAINLLQRAALEFESDETEAFVLVNRLLDDSAKADKIAGFAQSELTKALRSQLKRSVGSDSHALSPIEWLAGVALPETYSCLTEKPFKDSHNGPGLRFVCEALVAMSFRRFPLATLRVHRRQAMKKRARGG